MSSTPIKSRLVLYFPGFEAISSEAQLGRLDYSTKKTEPVWNFKRTSQPTEFPDGQKCAVSSSLTKGSDWQVETRFVHFDWSDIIRSHTDWPYPSSLVQFLPKFLSFFIDGTNIRYFKTSRRYWAFSIFPLMAIFLFLAFSWLSSGWILSLLSISSLIAQLFLTLLLSLILIKWPGDKIYLNLSINMSGFIRNIAKGDNAVINDRVENFTNILRSEIENSDHDEILIVGHCVGVLWLSLALAKILKDQPDIFKTKNIVVFSLASNIPRAGLAPCAQYIRDSLAQTISCPDLFWHDIQTKDDIISFYKVNQFEVLGVSNIVAKHITHQVRFKDGMNADRYKKMRRSFYRTHRQYVLSYDKPVHYDFILRCFGPFSAKELALNTELAYELLEN